MVKTTREQRVAIKRMWERNSSSPIGTLTYRELRACARPTFGCDGAVALPWAGMWLCIERDGYTHS